MDSQSSSPKQRGIIDPRWKIYLQPFSVQLPHAPPEDRTFRIPGTDISMEIEISHPTYEEGYDFTLPSRTFVFDSDSDDDETEEITNNKNKTSQLRNIPDSNASPPNSGNGYAPGNIILPPSTPYGYEPAQTPTTVIGGSLPLFPTEQVPYYPTGISNIHSTAMVIYSADQQQHFPNYSTGSSIPVRAPSTWQHRYSKTQHSGWPIANFAPVPVVYGASPRGNSTTNTKCTRFQLTTDYNYGNMAMSTGYNYGNMAMSTGCNYGNMPMSTDYNYGNMAISTGYNYGNIPMPSGYNYTNTPMPSGIFNPAPPETYPTGIPVPLNATTTTFTGQYQQSGESFNFMQQQSGYTSATLRRACNFCIKSGETDESLYTHDTKDPITGRVNCPVLRRVTCPKCKATGDNAHTLRHCPTKRKPSKS